MKQHGAWSSNHTSTKRNKYRNGDLHGKTLAEWTYRNQSCEHPAFTVSWETLKVDWLVFVLKVVTVLVVFRPLEALIVPVNWPWPSLCVAIPPMTNLSNGFQWSFCGHGHQIPACGKHPRRWQDPCSADHDSHWQPTNSPLSTRSDDHCTSEPCLLSQPKGSGPWSCNKKTSISSTSTNCRNLHC